jgi:hypothetical protein
MDEYSIIKSDSVTNKHPTAEQFCHFDNQQQENSTQNRNPIKQDLWLLLMKQR